MTDATHQGQPDANGFIKIEDGDFAGWRTRPRDSFCYQAAGPFYSKKLEDGSIVCAIKVEKKHLNVLGMVHGGALMTFADHALFQISQYCYGPDEDAITVTFNSEFLGAAREGEVVEARGEVTREGRSMIFVRGMLTADGKPCLAFSAALKRIKLRD